MKSEKKELIKNFKVVVEDLLDNYEKYTDEEKAYDVHYELNWKTGR